MTLDGSGPLYDQIYRALRGSILDGALSPGARLPSSRTLAAEIRVSRNVVVLAYEQLLAEGYVQARVGAGTFVAATLPALPRPVAGRPRASPGPIPPRLSQWGRRSLEEPTAPGPQRPELEIDFRYGFAPPDPDLLRRWRRCVVRAFDRYPLDYAPAAGHPALRSALARHLRLQRGVRCQPEQILVVGGSQQALDLASRLLLDPGDAVVIEEPHYQGARAVFRAAGARLLAAPVDAQGMDPTGPPLTDPGCAARLAYVTPSHQFPTGAVMPLTRRLALLDWAERHDAWVLEDDYDSEFRYESRPIEAVQGLDARGRTLYAGTLSKVMFPALRLGFLVVPPALVDAFRGAKWLADRHSPLLEQIALADFIETGQLERHLRRMRSRHAERRQVLMDSMAEHLGRAVQVMGTESGIHVVAWCAGQTVATVPALMRRAAAVGVGLHDIAPYYLAPPPKAGFLLGYGALELEQIREGIRRLAPVLGVP